MQCNATPRDRREKHTNQGTKNNGHQGKAMKHKDHVRKTQFDRVFCIQNLLDALRALEFVFTLEWFPTLGLE